MTLDKFKFYSQKHQRTNNKLTMVCKSTYLEIYFMEVVFKNYRFRYNIHEEPESVKIVQQYQGFWKERFLHAYTSLKIIINHFAKFGFSISPVVLSLLYILFFLLNVRVLSTIHSKYSSLLSLPIVIIYCVYNLY